MEPTPNQEAIELFEEYFAIINIIHYNEKYSWKVEMALIQVSKKLNMDINKLKEIIQQ